MPPKTPAIPREVLEPLLCATPLTAQDIRAVVRSDQWNTLQSRNAQVAFLAELAERQCGIQLLNPSLAEAFGQTASHIRTIRAKLRKKQKPPRRPLSLTNDQEKAIREMVRERAIAGIYVTQREVLNFVETEFRKTLRHEWSDCFLKRQSGDIRKIILAPQDLHTLQIPCCCLDQYITLIKARVPLVPDELIFIFNLYETGLSDWEEKKPKSALIPTDLWDSHFTILRTAQSAIKHAYAVFLRRETHMTHVLCPRIGPYSQCSK
jgi:hypothetical protein